MAKSAVVLERIALSVQADLSQLGESPEAQLQSMRSQSVPILACGDCPNGCASGCKSGSCYSGCMSGCSSGRKASCCKESCK